ncbi:hypothetical protein Tco_1455220 [Tanacetum coccineum]
MMLKALLHHPLARRMWNLSLMRILAVLMICPQLDHEDLEQLDKFDLEEMDLKWQVAMISIRMKKFYKKTGKKLQFDAKEPVGFDKTDKYGYIKNHKKTVKNGQARTRESEEYKRSQSQKSQALSQTVLKIKLKYTSAMVKHTRDVGFALNSLTKEAQAVTSRNDSLAILECTQ